MGYRQELAEGGEREGYPLEQGEEGEMVVYLQEIREGVGREEYPWGTEVAVGREVCPRPGTTHEEGEGELVH